MRLSLLTAAIAFLLMGAEPQQDTDQAAQILMRFQGEWIVVSTEGNGEVLQAEKKGSWTFEDTKLISSSDEKREIATFELRPEKSPAEIDLRYDEVDKDRMKTERIIRGIYELRDKKLRVGLTAHFCPSTPERELEIAIQCQAKRPTSFDTKAIMEGYGGCCVLTVIEFKKVEERED